MELIVLGCRAGMPAEGEPSSGYLVDTGAERLLLDCGPGVLTALTAATDVHSLDAVVISHLHVDHCHDLLPLGRALLGPLSLRQYPGVHIPGDAPRDLPRVPLFVPAGARTMLDAWAGLLTIESMPVLNRVFDGAFEVREYSPGDQFQIGSTRIEMVGLRHAKPNSGVRISAGGSVLAYTGDTGDCPALLDLARGAGLLLAEASLERPDVSDHGHLCAADAARAAATARAGRLVLTHLAFTDELARKTRAAEAAELFAGPIHLARPGERYRC